MNRSRIPIGLHGLVLALCLGAITDTADAQQWRAIPSTAQSQGETLLSVNVPTGFTSEVEQDGRKQQSRSNQAIFHMKDSTELAEVSVLRNGTTVYTFTTRVQKMQDNILQFQQLGGGTQQAGASVKGPASGSVAAGSTFVGRIKNCTPFATRLDFVLAGRPPVPQPLGGNSSSRDVDLPGGEYTVKIYRTKGSDSEFVTSSKMAIARDGWVYPHGCEIPLPDESAPFVGLKQPGRLVNKCSRPVTFVFKRKGKNMNVVDVESGAGKEQTLLTGRYEVAVLQKGGNDHLYPGTWPITQPALLVKERDEWVVSANCRQ